MSDLLEVLKLAERLNNIEKFNKIKNFEPYEKQKEFLHSLSKEKVILGANQCIGGEQEIYDPVACMRRRVDSINEPFHVLAWDGEKRVVARAGIPFKKGMEHMYRILFRDGTEMTVSPGHRFLGPYGWITARDLIEWSSQYYVCLFPPSNGPFPTGVGVDSVGNIETQIRILNSGQYINPFEEVVKNVVKIDYLKIDEVWDFSVDYYENYFVGGVLNHNSGKTSTGTYEIALHLTGLYPDSWKGVRFDHPVEWWVIGETATRVRDTLQEKLFGSIGEMGTGWIPKDCINEENIIGKSNVPRAIDKAMIKHVTGGFSKIQFFSYDQGREKFQGSTIDGYTMDEEPPPEIDSECRMRIIVKGGYAHYTFTPLKGVTKLYEDLTTRPDVKCIVLTVDDVGHLGKEQIERMKIGLSEEEIQARLYGKATRGLLQVFQFDPDEYTCEPFELGKHWRRVGGLDVGMSHPTAAVAIAVDDESGSIYCYREYSKSGSSPVTHAAILKKWGIQFATDPSAWNRTINGSLNTGRMYQEEGLQLFKADNDSRSSINKIRSLMCQGKLFIFSNCTSLLKELKTYRFKEAESGESKIYKIDDDLVDAFRYAIMSTDKATVIGYKEQPNPVMQWKPVSDYGY